MTLSMSHWDENDDVEVKRLDWQYGPQVEVYIAPTARYSPITLFLEPKDMPEFYNIFTTSSGEHTCISHNGFRFWTTPERALDILWEVYNAETVAV